MRIVWDCGLVNSRECRLHLVLTLTSVDFDESTLMDYYVGIHLIIKGLCIKQFFFTFNFCKCNFFLILLFAEFLKIVQKSPT